MENGQKQPGLRGIMHGECSTVLRSRRFAHAGRVAFPSVITYRNALRRFGMDNARPSTPGLPVACPDLPITDSHVISTFSAMH